MTANSEWLWGFKFDSESTNIYASIPSFYHAATAMDANSTLVQPTMVNRCQEIKLTTG